MIDFNNTPTSVILYPGATQWQQLRRKSEGVVINVQKPDRRLIAGITFFIIVQCILVIVTAATILSCKWSPDLFTSQTVKVIMVMYLYDYQKCGYGLKKTKGIQSINLDEYTLYDSQGSNLKFIPFAPLVKSTSIRLTQSVHLHMEVSIGFHCAWFLISITALLFCHLEVNFKYRKIMISIFMYSCIFMVIFDVSMAIVYLAHIQQSLTIAMVLRHAGWAVEMEVDNPEQFAGWIPMLASVMWLRCIIFLSLNVLSIKKIWIIRKKIKKREVQKKHLNKNSPIPYSVSRVREDDSENTYVVHSL